MQQPCSNADAGGKKLDDQKHREEIRRLVAEAPDEPTHCEFKQTLSYATPKEKGELVKDVSAFANADLETVGGHGYIVFGVANDGRVVGMADVGGDPSSASRQIVNGYLGRSVGFEYLTCEVDDKVGGTKRVAAIVVPDSRRRPHVVSREIKEQKNGKDKFWLRKGEVWVRKTGGRDLATADDVDEMYEGKLRRLVEERVRPLQGRIEELERDLREQRTAVPELGFGFVVPTSTGPSLEGHPSPVLNNLIDVDEVRREIERAKRKSSSAAQKEPTRISPPVFGVSTFSTGEPDAEAYDRYRRGLEKWLVGLEDLYVVDFALVNNGRVPAEDVEVVLEVPAGLGPRAGSLEWPLPPQNNRLMVYRPSAYDTPSFVVSKPPPPDSLGEPDIFGSGSPNTVKARWEVDKLYHGRPLFTHSEGDAIEGLLISVSGYEELLSRAGSRARLTYVVRAANLPDAHSGAVILV